MWLIGVVDAGTLGWAQMLTNVSTEVRAVGGAALILALCFCGIEIILHRRLDTLGNAMACIGVGGGLIAGGPTAAAALLGTIGATPLTSPLVQTMGLSEGLPAMLEIALYLWPMMTLGSRVARWRADRRGE